MGKLALVTGASSGIGLELARQFVEHGFDVILNAEDDELAQAEASLAGSGAEVRAVKADLATAEGVERLWAAVTAGGGHWMPPRSTLGSGSTGSSPGTSRWRTTSG